ncbi:hypothetical protein TUM20985_28340 [Mycobacterium antarcticum]|nr:hypothetical protein TUM20985_28340 [Mycolicibacterium sp. TUM20985]GLP75559.1 hypothetical protein TUM20983_26690 [Mycolicibacterium sp. TUM20983]GLP84167.1 hypothetical protein TUM20984_55870 [Mycolicibacterium sp. TUM20984]
MEVASEYAPRVTHKAITLAEQPSLRDMAIPDADIWPEFNLQGETYRRFWTRLSDELPEFQFAMCDEQTGEVMADAHTVPCWWDGTQGGLPGGFDAVIADAFRRRDAEQPFNTLCAIAAEIPKDGRGGGLAVEILVAMGDIATRHGFTQLIAPVRPTLKDRYPITPIEQYMNWRREDGTPVDPWLRLHERIGATMGPSVDTSYRIEGTVGEWESWLDMVFPESGAYVFPGGLSPLDVDRDADRAVYGEPNVWMIHDLASLSKYEAPVNSSR